MTSTPSPSKPIILFLPGLLCDAALWQNQIDFLKSEYSPMVADLTQHDSVSGMAERIITNMKGKKFHLVALSMGGYVAFELMRKIPEQVLTLSLINTAAGVDSDETKRRRKGLIGMADIGKFKGVTPKLIPMLIDESRLDDKEITGIIMEMAERVGKDAFVNQQNAILSRKDSRGDLKNISVPTLVIGGENDKVTPVEKAREMAEKIPNARLVVYEGCGHLSPLECPDEVNQELKEHLTSRV